jgi:hypothetical protein
VRFLQRRRTFLLLLHLLGQQGCHADEGSIMSGRIGEGIETQYFASGVGIRYLTPDAKYCVSTILRQYHKSLLAILK